MKKLSQEQPEEEHSYYRASAACAFSGIRIGNFQFEDAFQCLRFAVKTCKEAPASEKQSHFQVQFAPTSLTLQTTIQQLNEAIFGGCRSQKWVPMQTGPVDNMVPPIVGGGFCDACGKTYEELGVEMLTCCGVCQLAHYCSRECQKKHWKEGGNKLVG